MSVRGPYTNPSSKQRRRSTRVPSRPAWSPWGFVAAILGILVVTLAIVLAVSR
jgi:hypothetical protein